MFHKQWGMLEGFDLNEIAYFIGLIGIVPLALAWKAWSLGKSTETKFFGYLMISCAAYCIFYAFELAANQLDVKVFFLKLQYLGAVFFGPFMFLLILHYSGSKLRKLTFLWLLFMIPAIILLIVFSNDIHFLFYASYGIESYEAGSVLVTQKAIFYWIHQAYTLVLLLASQGLILQMIKNQPVSASRQVNFVWLGMSLPLAAYLIHLAGIVPMKLDPIPISFMGTGIFVFLGLTKYRLFKETPIVYKTLFESISDGVLVYDRTGNLVSCNPVASEFLSKVILFRKSNALSVQVDTSEHLKEVLKDAEGQEVVAFKGQREGMLKWYSASRSPIIGAQESTLGEIVVLRDVTSEKEYQRKLELAKEEADRANSAKSEFLANISHEIRTPLNGVIGFTELLKSTPLSEQQQRYVSTAFNSANALLELINNVLDFSKIEAGKIELDYQEVDLPQLIRTVADVMSFQASKSGIEFLIHLPADVPNLVRMDELRLKQILINLLNNALKFTEEGEVELAVLLREKIEGDKALLRFLVKDSGIGIDPVKQALIFEAFSQADASTTKKYGGTGLGLAISNKLLAIMGSGLQLESTLKKGSTFYFDILVDVLDTRPTRREFKKQAKALLVGFQPSLAKNTARYLDQLGIRGHFCDTVSEAKSLLEPDGEFDYLFFTERGAAFEETYPLLKDFKNWGSTRKLPPYLLLLPASMPDQMLVTLHAIGFTRRLTKPLMLDNLSDAISKVERIDMKEEGTETGKESRDFSHFSVLVAEDNAVNRMLIRVYLGNIFPGIKVVEATDGKIALERFISEKPNLVISDIQMPEMNGYDLATAIRKELSEEKMGIIALTANSSDGEEEKCLAHGFDEFISKPVRQEIFEAVIRKWVKESPRET